MKLRPCCSKIGPWRAIQLAARRGNPIHRKTGIDLPVFRSDSTPSVTPTPINSPSPVLKQIIGQKPQPVGPPAPPAPVEPAYSYPPPAAETYKPAPSYSTPPPAKSTFSMSTNKNILSSDVEIKGSLKFSNDLIIDGKIEGEVSSDGSLTVGENALVIGEIRTKSVVVFGKVQGNITVTERCELKSNAIQEGDIVAGTMSIEEGATFMGKSSVGKNAVANAQAQKKAAAPAAAQS